MSSTPLPTLPYRINVALPVDGKRIRATQGLSIQTLLELAQDPVIVTTLVVAVGAGLGGLYLDTTVNNNAQQLRQQIVTAQQDSLRLSRDLQEAERLRQTRARAADDLLAVAAVDRNRFALPRLLERLARDLGENMWITSLGTDAPNASTNDIGWVVTGYAPTRSLVARYLDRLSVEDNVLFVVADSIREEQRNGIPIVAFQLQGRTHFPDSARVTFVPLGQGRPVTSGVVAGEPEPPADVSALWGRSASGEERGGGRPEGGSASDSASTGDPKAFSGTLVAPAVDSAAGPALPGSGLRGSRPAPRSVTRRDSLRPPSERQ